mmetsp:Transcript_1533/g.2088  ORF Transcript_1533/g.2088 Transcript_1533/m.2088 type:complete len:214 (+) Transcript_1533:144-785(+)|eukprot:CAMPEP_0206479888 /NCGR_PEP_ID=MMETSP0324_2-20121206/36932_1 /ASSEMBLY_ACC=CAM_ASM_000836 /TAXON_ID=2866 /ORGANISM="Crypthecodinium cohnii, Strain Seligo" /LENGTH=213 /DNA_ID=CAMNT_0053956501 /DNA_START=165 /DNA_END=806 /DNA_ORIENTATION=+
MDKVLEAEKNKAQGNDFVKEGNFKKALYHYNVVFNYLNGLQIPGESSGASEYAGLLGGTPSSDLVVPADKVEVVKDLKRTTHLNKALCHFKLERYEKCVESCSQSIALGNESSKAYFRRAQARRLLGDLDAAQSDLDKARLAGGENRAIDQEFAEIQRALKIQEAKEKKRYQKMFGKLAADDAKAVAPAEEVPASESAAAPTAGTTAAAAAAA